MKIEPVEMGVLSREERKLVKDLEKEGATLQASFTIYRSKLEAYWDGLRRNHNLSFCGHYIKDGRIYKQIIDGNS